MANIPLLRFLWDGLVERTHISRDAFELYLSGHTTPDPVHQACDAAALRRMEALTKMESVGTLHPYKSDHVTVGSSKSRVLEKILIIFPLYQGPGTEFQAVKCYSFFVDSAKTSGTLVEPMANHS
jgi:hypothetical protein